MSRPAHFRGAVSQETVQRHGTFRSAAALGPASAYPQFVPVTVAKFVKPVTLDMLYSVGIGDWGLGIREGKNPPWHFQFPTPATFFSFIGSRQVRINCAPS